MALRIRTMTADDAEAVSALRIEGWRHAYRGLVPRSYLESMDAGKDSRLRREALSRPDRQGTDLVTEDDVGTVTGWVAFGPHRADDGPEGSELYALYVRPDRIGTGTGRALLDEWLLRCERARSPRLWLWVLEGNTPARRFYERAGFRPDGARSTFTVRGREVPEVRYARAPGRDA